jgi:hypothetical protein
MVMDQERAAAALQAVVLRCFSDEEKSTKSWFHQWAIAADATDRGPSNVGRVV